MTIDEIQKASHLLTPIKMYIDKQRENGDFLLTGSANVLNLKKSNESLAGRLIELTMYPFSAKEKNQDIDTNFVDMLFEIDNFIRFFNVLAPRSANILNKSNIANDTKLNASTIDNYLSLLEKVYQIHLLKPYYENIGKTFIKSPKVYLTDSGISSHILGIRDEKDLESSRYKGDVYETFVFAELLKHITYSQNIMEFFYYRTQDKKEIDFIVKKQEKILAIEVKSSYSVKQSDFKHIIDFQNRSAYEVMGLVFYHGEKVVGFGDNLFAVPFGSLL